MKLTRPLEDIFWGLGMAAITWSGPIYKCTNSKEPVLENICGSKIFLIVLWQYDPDITLYLNANYSKWWQPQVKTERGTEEIPSTTQPPSQHHYGLQSHLLSFLTAWLVSPRVYVCNIGHRNLFPHKIAYRKILQWRSQSMMTDQCFSHIFAHLILNCPLRNA